MMPKKKARPYHDAVKTEKIRLIRQALRLADGNRTEAAEKLGLQRTYLLRLMRDLEIQDYSRPPAMGIYGWRPANQARLESDTLRPTSNGTRR